jgi:hypothetical protein
MLRRVALVWTDISSERIASIIRVTRIDELGTTLAVTSNRLTLPRNSESPRECGNFSDSIVKRAVSLAGDARWDDSSRAVWTVVSGICRGAFPWTSVTYILPYIKVGLCLLSRSSLSKISSIVRRLLVTANFVPSSPILVTLMKVAQSSSKSSVLTRATRRNFPEDDIFYSHRRENLKSYIALTVAELCSGDVMCLLWSTNWVFISQKTAFFIATAMKTSNLP